MSLNLERLVADVAALKTVDASILALVAGLVVKLRDVSAQLSEARAGTDPAAQKAAQDRIDALATDLETETAALTQAVTANTPAAN